MRGRPGTGVAFPARGARMTPAPVVKVLHPSELPVARFAIWKWFVPFCASTKIHYTQWQGWLARVMRLRGAPSRGLQCVSARRVWWGWSSPGWVWRCGCCC